MADPTNDQDQIKRATAVLATCIVQTLNESDPSFQERFVSRLVKAYDEMKYDPLMGDPVALELIAWTKTLITGYDPVAGLGKVFLED